jgi:hypothetical protein
VTAALRLPSDRRADFLNRYCARVAEQHGRMMAEFAEVPASLLPRTAELQPWFDASLEWVSSLRPRPTRRPPAQDGRT